VLSKTEMLNVEMKLTQMQRDGEGLLEIFRAQNLQHSAHAMSAVTELLTHVVSKFHKEHKEKQEAPQPRDKRRRS
jgi:hypothetical protein